MNLGALVSESRNPATLRLDEMTTLEMVSCFNQEDRKVPEAIEKVLPAIAQAVDLAAAADLSRCRDQRPPWRVGCL